MEKFFVPVAALLLVLVLVFFGFAPQLVEFTLNRVAASTSSNVPPQARMLHEALDLHADSFLWGDTYWKRAAEATRMFRD
jgi:hypothetical protein